MLTDIDKMNDEARVWVYQADRPVSADEKDLIQKELGAFLGQWAAHGSDLKAAGDLLHSHFLVICIDESFQMASGCSIDSSVRFVQELGQKLGIDFFKRTNLAFDLENGVELIEMSNLKGAIEAGKVHAESLFYDNTIKNKGQLVNQWGVKASESWLKRYFKASLSV